MCRYQFTFILCTVFICEMRYIKCIKSHGWTAYEIYSIRNLLRMMQPLLKKILNFLFNRQSQNIFWQSLFFIYYFSKFQFLIIVNQTFQIIYFKSNKMGGKRIIFMFYFVVKRKTASNFILKDEAVFVGTYLILQWTVVFSLNVI